MALTRDQIKNGDVRKMIADLGITMRLLSDDELAASRAAILAAPTCRAAYGCSAMGR